MPSTLTGAHAGPHDGRPLADWTLPVHARRVAVPGYDRSALIPSVVHIGVGGFHRAHQAVYFDDLARAGDTGWGIVGVSLRRPDIRDCLAPQDCLFTVVERDARRESARIIGSIVRCLCAPEDPEAVLAALADPRTRLVTLTVTADGYGVTRGTSRFEAHAPAVREELAHASRPVTAYGYLVEALARRRAAGRGGLTVLSCDNLPDNGATARAAVLGFAHLRDPALAAWIEEHVAFPSSMVDRITPSTTDEDRRAVADRFGVRDRAPVVAEPFSQWIVEDDFAGARPPLEDVGVQFVDDVAPYKLTKAMMLNGSHTALAHLGTLASHRTTDQALADPVFADYLDQLMQREVGPLLGTDHLVDLDDYRATLMRRFANPAMGDRLARLAERGSTKLPSYVLPSLETALRTDAPHSLLVLSVAGWMRHLRGHDREGRTFPVEDPLAETLQPIAREMGNDPRPLLAQEAVFGDLGREPGLVAALSRSLVDLDRLGARATVATYLQTEMSIAA